MFQFQKQRYFRFSNVQTVQMRGRILNGDGNRIVVNEAALNLADVKFVSDDLSFI